MTPEQDRNLLVPMDKLREITLGSGITYVQADEATRVVAQHCLAECLKAGIPAELTPEGTGVQAARGTLTLHTVRPDHPEFGAGDVEYLLFAWTPNSSNPAMGHLGDPFEGLPVVTINLEEEP